MKKRPILLRWIFSLIVVAVFAYSIYPPFPRDFYKTFDSILIKHDNKIEEVIKLAKAKQKKDKSLYATIAVEEAANELNVDLTKYVKGKGLLTNKDVTALVRREAGASIRLGLDLAGGAEFLLELLPQNESSAMQPKPGVERQKGTKIKTEKGEKEETSVKKPKREKPKPLSESYDRYRDIAIEILRNRLESQKIYECEISPAGSRYISLKVPVVSKEEKLKLLNLIQMSAKLQFRLVHKDNDDWVAKWKKNPNNVPVGYEKMELIDRSPGKKPQKRIYFVKKIPEMGGKNIVYAAPYLDRFGRREIQIRFNSKGAAEFGEVTSRNVGRLLAIVLDGKLYSAPQIKQPITGGDAVITGNFSKEEAENIANALVSGSLPVKINVQAVFDTDPTVGADAVRTGAISGIIALIAVALFMSGYYLIGGIIADIALIINVVLVLGALSAFQATLTLPGIAGIILTIGMAVDANVLIMERIREELRNNKTLLNAIDTGYSRAFITILDANLTTLFVALILMWQGTGPIKGFAVTLAIGILTSMFTALFLTRLIFDSTATKLYKKLNMFHLFKDSEINFLHIWKIAGTISGIFILGSILVVAYRGSGCFGIDFKGGTQIVIPFKGHRVPEEQIKKVMKKAGYKEFKISYKSSSGISEKQMLEIVIPNTSIANLKSKTGNRQISPMEHITGILNKAFKDIKSEGGQETSLGGLIGKEFTRTAIIAILLAIIGIIIYISLRFEFTYAIASIVALIHDITIATGIFLLFGRELSLPVIAALLTILGYSLNDTIVVFDRIRENLQLIKNKTYKEIINLSINQTLSRTIITSFTTLLVLVVLFFFGGVGINDFVFVMLIGVIVGTYSSIYIASPIVAFWHKRIGAGRK